MRGEEISFFSPFMLNFFKIYLLTGKKIIANLSKT